MTATSADNSTSAGDSGDWGWFTPRRRTLDPQRPSTSRSTSPEATSEQPLPHTRATEPFGDDPAQRAEGDAPATPRVTTRHPEPAPDSAEPRATAAHEPAGPATPAGSAEHPHPPGPTATPARKARPRTTTADPDLAGLSPDAVRLRRTLAELEPHADEVVAHFYAVLFVTHPELRDLFPISMDAQRDRLFKALLTAARLLDDEDLLTQYLSNLGRGHRKYGTRPEHYPAVGEALMHTLAQYAVESWDEETEAAWVRAYTTFSQIMIDAAAEHEAFAPAWWEAEIVAHERPTSDVAVLTLRPDQPYPFRAGQYTSVETPWWPRVWRHYSLASCPRPDGLLTLHVKAVPAGWVSRALVHRAAPGDVIRLGPPAGSMTVDHHSDNGMVCLGGSTGIAPIKAMVEEVAEYGSRRPVEIFYGARSDRDLYDLDTMLGLAERHPWLSVRPVVSVGPSTGGLVVGELPDAVRAYGPFTSYDGYLSGPPGLIRSGVDALVGAGIPAHRIRHDAVEELAAVTD